MKSNGAEFIQERLREETGHSACHIERRDESFSGYWDWLEIACGDCGEKRIKYVSRPNDCLHTPPDFEDPDVRELIEEMRKSFCKELDWNRIWF